MVAFWQHQLQGAVDRGDVDAIGNDCILNNTNDIGFQIASERREARDYFFDTLR